MSRVTRRYPSSAVTVLVLLLGGCTVPAHFLAGPCVWADEPKVSAPSIMTDARPLVRPELPLIVAHRGFSAIAQENTLAAFRAAIEAGSPAAECDVYLSADGHVILSHDATVNRCTDGTGRIPEMTLAELRALDAGSWKGPQYAGECIPTLAETLELLRGKMHLVVEVKQPGIAEQVAKTIRSCNALGACTIISFNLETCAQMRQIEPALPVGWLTGGIPEDDSELAEQLLETALSANVQFVDVAYKGIRPALLKRAQLAGMAVWAWTVDNPADMQDLARTGVACITTNDPALALKTLTGP